MITNGPITDIYFADDNLFNLAYQFDLGKSNLFRVHYRDNNMLYQWARDKSDYFGLMLEGVHMVNVYYGDSGVLFECLTGDLEYPIFQKKYLEGLEAASKHALDISKGLNLPAEYLLLMVYAFITSNVRFDYDSARASHEKNAHHIESWMTYGALCSCLAVCEGSSWAMIRMLSALGFVCFPVFGYRGDGFHQWVKVFLNDNWYNIEVTNTGSYQQIPIEIFLVSDETMIKNGYRFYNELNYFAGTDKRYEGKPIINIINQYYNDIGYYISQGVDAGWSNIRFEVRKIKL